eukprot:Skav226056  [mRNA]  locus=scaffold211:272173:276303:- [translate_table: standard]
MPGASLDGVGRKFQGPTAKEAPSVAIAASRTGQLEILKHLWTEGCDTMLLHRMWWLPPFLPMGTTACHEAASCGHAEVVQWLLECRADPEALDSTACSPLHLAATHGHVEVLRALRSVDQQHVGSTNALHQAAFGGHLAAVQFLLEVVDVTGGDALEQTALHYAALRGHWEVLEELLRHSASVNARDQRGRSPLHACAQALSDPTAVLVPLAAAAPTGTDQNWKAAMVLLDMGADGRSRDNDGQTPWDLARAGRHWKVADLLQGKSGTGADRVSANAPKTAGALLSQRSGWGLDCWRTSGGPEGRKSRGRAAWGADASDAKTVDRSSVVEMGQ